MKAFIVIAVIVIGAIILLNPQSKAQVTGNADDVQVIITTSGKFTGAIGAGANQRTVDGEGYRTFTLSGKDSKGIFIASIFKESTNASSLTVTLKGCPDGKEHTQVTTSAIGGVTVTC